jgi:hypothetical protein
MIILKIVQFLALLFFLSVLIKLVFNFIKENRRHSKRMEKLDQWSDFHKQLIEWSNEITDSNVKVDFINECVHKIIQNSNSRLRPKTGMDIGQFDDWSIDKEKSKICEKWGKHIPSLTQEIREKKLNQIL